MRAENRQREDGIEDDLSRRLLGIKEIIVEIAGLGRDNDVTQTLEGAVEKEGLLTVKKQQGRKFPFVDRPIEFRVGHDPACVSEVSGDPGIKLIGQTVDYYANGGRFVILLDVITSYSIHYTKLYE